MNQSVVKVEFDKDKLLLNADILYSLFEEDGVYVAYSPDLELSTQADTRSEAKDAFEEAMSMFLDDLIKSKNLFETLKELGWKTQEDKAYKKSSSHLKNEKISNFQYALA